MAVIKNYNREYHDLFLYDPMVSYQPLGQGIPVAYNPKCEAIKNGVDFSGCAARNQRFNNRASGFVTPENISDINLWNNGYFAAVLITPRHALVCHHYHGETQTHPQIPNLRWLGKDGKFYRRNAIRNKRLWLHDLRLVEFDEEFPVDQVKIYNRIADVRYIPRGHPMWVQDAQNRIYRFRLKNSQTHNNQEYGEQTSWSHMPYTDDGMGYNEGMIVYPSQGQGPISPNIYAGDSGSPTFVLTETGETILVGLAWGGSIITPSIMTLIKQEINDEYPLEFVKVAAKSGDFNQDGKVDAADMTMLMSKWGSFDKLYDLNKDGTVDGGDLSVLQSQWGEYGMTHSVVIIPPTPWDPSPTADVIPFPSNPTTGQQFIYAGIIWTWNGNGWQTLKIEKV